MKNQLKIVNSALKNPATDYFRFLANWWGNRRKYKNYYQGYMALVINSEISPFVSVYDRARVVESKIGSYSYVYEDSSVHRTEIGKFCSIGANCTFRLGIHPSKDYVSSHPIFYSTKKQVGISFSDADYFVEEKPVKVGNDVWVGTNAVIMDGVTIGDGAIIAAGALVTKDVPPYAIYGGVPAKLIRYKFDEKTIDFLLNFQWWNREEGWLKEHFKDFHDIEKFMAIYGNDMKNV